MSARRHSLLLVFGVLAFALLPARVDALSEIERLETAVREHRDDADLVWALAQRLAESDRLPEAVERLGGYIERWPDRRPDAELTLGRWLYDLGRDEEAVGHLERAVARLPVSGVARFHLGLALSRLGRHEEAESQFRVTEDLEPELRSESLLLRALMLLDVVDDAGGEALLRENQGMVIDC